MYDSNRGEKNLTGINGMHRISFYLAAHRPGLNSDMSVTSIVVKKFNRDKQDGQDFYLLGCVLPKA